MNHPRLFVVLAALLLNALPALAGPDGTSPKAAYRSYLQAMNAGNLDDLKAGSITSPRHVKMLEGFIAYNKVEDAFRAAVIKSYPLAAKSLPNPNDAALKSLDNAETKIDGDSATLVTSQSLQPVQLKKDGANWKVDLVSMFPEDALDEVIRFREAMSAVMQDMMPDVETRKYKDFDELMNTLKLRVEMRRAMSPDDDTTTQPAE